MNPFSPEMLNMTSAQKNLVIETIKDEMEINPPPVEMDMPAKGQRVLTVGGKSYRVVGKHKEK